MAGGERFNEALACDHIGWHLFRAEQCRHLDHTITTPSPHHSMVISDTGHPSSYCPCHHDHKLLLSMSS
eukprot:1195551-Prorocentrum_minimum.AAC.2